MTNLQDENPALANRLDDIVGNILGKIPQEISIQEVQATSINKLSDDAKDCTWEWDSERGSVYKTIS